MPPSALLYNEAWRRPAVHLMPQVVRWMMERMRRETRQVIMWEYYLQLAIIVYERTAPTMIAMPTADGWKVEFVY